MTLRELINSVDSELYCNRSATKGDACLSKNKLYQKLRDTKSDPVKSRIKYKIKKSFLLFLRVFEKLWQKKGTSFLRFPVVFLRGI